MIEFSRYNNRISNYGLGFYWTGIAKPKPVVVIASNFNFYGGLGFLMTWNAKGSTSPTGTVGKYRCLMGVGV